MNPSFMNDREQLLDQINKYIVITCLALFFIQWRLDSGDVSNIFNPSDIRLLAAAALFSALYFTRLKVPFRVKSILSLSTAIVLFILYPVYAPGVDPSDLILVFICVIITSIIPFSIFHPHKEIKKTWAWSLFLLLCAFVAIYATILKISQTDYAGSFLNLLRDEPMIPFAFLGSYITINWIISRYQRTHHFTQKSVEETNDDLEKQIKLAEAQTLELEAQQRELITLHNSLKISNSNLEKKVAERTEDLRNKSKLLIRYSYLNSHFLRAPLTRIQASMSLWDELEQDRLEEILKLSCKEFKETIDLISELSGKRNKKPAGH